jgi:hypothetical protein
MFAQNLLPVVFKEQGLVKKAVPSFIKENNLNAFDLLYKLFPSTEEEPKFVQVALKAVDLDGDYPKNEINVGKVMKDADELLETIRDLAE